MRLNVVSFSPVWSSMVVRSQLLEIFWVQYGPVWLFNRNSHEFFKVFIDSKKFVLFSLEFPLSFSPGGIFVVAGGILSRY